MKRLLILGLLVVLLAGCSSVANLKTDDYADMDFNQTDWQDVKVFSMVPYNVEYYVIGQVVVDADAGTNAKTSVEKLKKQAAELGADAIINLRLEIDTGYWASGIKATGTAIKFNGGK